MVIILANMPIRGDNVYRLLHCLQGAKINEGRFKELLLISYSFYDLLPLRSVISTSRRNGQHQLKTTTSLLS